MKKIIDSVNQTNANKSIIEMKEEAYITQKVGHDDRLIFRENFAVCNTITEICSEAEFVKMVLVGLNNLISKKPNTDLTVYFFFLSNV